MSPVFTGGSFKGSSPDLRPITYTSNRKLLLLPIQMLVHVQKKKGGGGTNPRHIDLNIPPWWELPKMTEIILVEMIWVAVWLMCCIIYWIRMFGFPLLRLIFIHVNIKRGEGEESKRISTDFFAFWIEQNPCRMGCHWKANAIRPSYYHHYATKTINWHHNSNSRSGWNQAHLS